MSDPRIDAAAAVLHGFGTSTLPFEEAHPTHQQQARSRAAAALGAADTVDPLRGPRAGCTGAGTCRARVHSHGCFADTSRGACDSAEEHPSLPHMAAVIAEHDGHEVSTRTDGWMVECSGCEWERFSSSRPNGDALHSEHVAERLTAAGFGRLEMETVTEAVSTQLKLYALPANFSSAVINTGRERVVVDHQYIAAVADRCAPIISEAVLAAHGVSPYESPLETLAAAIVAAQSRPAPTGPSESRHP